jgi:hypothetical protein
LLSLLASLFALFLHNGPARTNQPVQQPTDSGSTHQRLTTSPVSADSPTKTDGGTVPGGN